MTMNWLYTKFRYSLSCEQWQWPHRGDKAFILTTGQSKLHHMPTGWKQTQVRLCELTYKPNIAKKQWTFTGICRVPFLKCRTSHLDTLSVQLQRPLSEIDPDSCLRVFQESAPAEPVGQTRLPHIWVSYYYYLENPSVCSVVFVVRGELQGIVSTENCVKFLPRFVFYCHCSSSRGLDGATALKYRETP